MVWSRKRRSGDSVFILLVVLLLNALSCAGVIYDFEIFNNPVYENDPRLNFTMTVSDEGSFSIGSWLNLRKVGFTFNNNSTVSSSITDVYFDAYPDSAGALIFSSFLDVVSVIEGPGVSFSKNADPASLPGGEELTPAFDKFPEYSADSDPPVSSNGINPGEWLKLVFFLKPDKTIDDIIAQIAAGGTTQANLRVGIHIQSLPCVQSLSYDSVSLNCCLPPPPVCCDDSASAINCRRPIPEPATIAFLIVSTAIVFRKNKYIRPKPQSIRQ